MSDEIGFTTNIMSNLQKAPSLNELVDGIIQRKGNAFDNGDEINDDLLNEMITLYLDDRLIYVEDQLRIYCEMVDSGYLKFGASADEFWSELTELLFDVCC